LLEKTFSNLLVIADYKQDSELMEWDVCIPEIALGVDYQWKQHYEQQQYLYGSPILQQLQTEAKRRACDKLGITTIEVPPWWNQQHSSLMEMITRHRPDLVQIMQDGASLTSTAANETSSELLSE